VTSETFSTIEGAVLVFLPGFADILTLYDMLESDRQFGDPKRYWNDFEQFSHCR